MINMDNALEWRNFTPRTERLIGAEEQSQWLWRYQANYTKWSRFSMLPRTKSAFCISGLGGRISSNARRMPRQAQRSAGGAFAELTISTRRTLRALHDNETGGRHRDMPPRFTHSAITVLFSKYELPDATEGAGTRDVPHETISTI